MFARTDRLLLRPGWREDAPQLHAAIGEESIVRNLTRAPWPYGIADAEAFLSSCGDDGLPRLLMFQRTAGTPRLVGGIGLTRDGTGEAELGYWIARPFWGLGFATEAGRAVTDMARRSLRLTRIVAGHALDNPASANVLRKLGFRATAGVSHRYSLGRGGVMPCLTHVLPLDSAAVPVPALAA